MTTASMSGDIYWLKLRQRLGREPTIDDLRDDAGRMLAADERKLRVRKTIAVRIRDARVDVELTQAQLGARMIPPATAKDVNRWERAHHPHGRVPSTEFRHRIADALEYAIDDPRRRRLWPEQEPDTALEVLTDREKEDLL